MSASAENMTEHYVWSVEGKPLSVHLSLDVVRRLQPSREISPQRALELGGILLGYLRKIGEVNFVSVEDLEIIPCEHARSESWHLSPKDKEHFHSRLRRLSRDRGTRPVPVGFFRTHTRRGLYLDQHDFHVLTDYFPDPNAVVLVVRPDTPFAMAGFFFREGNEIQRSFPLLAFPFAAEALSARVFSTPLPEAPEARRHVQVRVPPPRRKWLNGMRPISPRWSLSPQWQKALFIVPIAVGLAFGLFWNPTPLSRKPKPEASRTGAPRTEQRAVFSPPPLPEPETEPYTPPPEEVVETRARIQPPPPKVVKNLVVPKKRVTVREPVLETQAPSIAAVARFDGLPPAKVYQPARAAVTIEPARPSAIRRAVGSIPGLGFLKRKKQAADEDYVPPRVIHDYRPISPAALSEDVAVNVRLTVGADGQVEKAELLSHRVDNAVAQAAVDAAKKWRFRPATLDEKPVQSELVVHFRFGAGLADGS